MLKALVENKKPMNIITHNTPKTQVKILVNAEEKSKITKQVLSYGAHLTHIQRQALELYDIGMNVFPQPIGQKGGYPWKRLQFVRLNRDHHLYGVESLFIGQCNLAIMCGRTSDNLFIIDCESRASFEHHIKQLRQQDIPVWASKTARGGHIYLRATNGEIHNVPSGRLKETEIKGRNGYVLAPPSLHPSGTYYRWLHQEGEAPPTIDITQINWLVDDCGKTVRLKYDPVSHYTPGIRIDTYQTLSKETRNYINEGHLISEGYRNNTLFASACDLAGNGYTYEQTCKLIADKAIASGLSHEEVRNTLRSAYKKERTPTNKSYIKGDWYYALHFLVNEKLQGRKSATERAVILTLIERARLIHYHSNANNFRASIREIASQAKLSTRTVQLTLMALMEKQWITRNIPDRESYANTWQFGEQVITKGKEYELKTNTLAPLTPWLEYSVLLFNSDMVERRSLGHGALFLYRMMVGLCMPLMPLALSELTGLTVNQVNYALSKLRLFSLVERTSLGWIALMMSEATLKKITIDTDGKGNRRTQAFLMERQLFAGRMLYDARAKREKDAFLCPQRSLATKKKAMWIEQLLLDELVQEALSLGAVVVCEDGFILERRLE